MKLAGILLLALITGGAEKNYDGMIRADESLVVPGRGAERVVLNDSVDALLSGRGYPDRISEFKGGKELFQEVFRVGAPLKISFDKIYYYETKGLIVFIHAANVAAVAGLRRDNRVTFEGVGLGQGIDYFLFRYGNRGLKIIKKETDRIYIYPGLGIALIDDKSDDAIDMFLIFPRVPD